jgi:diaminopropionate ammonia-lyase
MRQSPSRGGPLELAIGSHGLCDGREDVVQFQSRGREATYAQNPWRRHHNHHRPSGDAYLWHRRQPYYEPTSLVDVTGLSSLLGFDRVWVKDERNRLGTKSFKVLGASWALHRALEQRQTAGRGSVETLLAATDGNHGRAVSHLARLHGLHAEVFVPHCTTAARIAAIEHEGATVHRTAGSYDEAVRSAAERADEYGDCGLLISDTSYREDDLTAQWSIEGYGTIFQEIEQELPRSAAEAPDLVIIQIGVGGLAAAAVRHFRADTPGDAWAPFLLGVEPTSAACAAASIVAGSIVSLEDSFDSVMVGLNTGTPSLAAWEDLKYGLDGFLTMSDFWCPLALAELTSAGLGPGPTGLAGVAGLLALHSLHTEDGSVVGRWFSTVRRPLLMLTESNW